MEFRDPSNHHQPHLYHSPAAQHHLNVHQEQQPTPVHSQPYSSCSSSACSYSPNLNPNPIHGFQNPLPSAVEAAEVLRPPGVDPYLHDSYASNLAYNGSHSIASQSYTQTVADYYYQHQQQYGANSFTYGVVGTGNKTADLETKKQKVIAGGAPLDSVRVCTICNVVCNSDKVFALHLAGEKHNFKAFGIPSNALKPKVPAHMKALHLSNKATHKAPEMAPKTAAKKSSKGLITFIQSSYCDVCKIDCNSQEVLNNHKLGRKHIKNLQKLQEAINPKPANAPTVNLTMEAKPIASEKKAVNEQPKQNAGPATKEDLETKKQKVLSGGAAADAVRVCTHCNVVCNSQAVYNSHIAGKKHMIMVTKQQQPAPVS